MKFYNFDDSDLEYYARFFSDPAQLHLAVLDDDYNNQMNKHLMWLASRGLFETWTIFINSYLAQKNRINRRPQKGK